MKRTNSLMRVFAVLMLTMILVSSFAVSASAAVTDTAISACKADTKTDDGYACSKLKEIYGATSDIKFSTTETETCKYATSITLANGKVITVFLSQKPTTGDIGVQMVNLITTVRRSSSRILQVLRGRLIPDALSPSSRPILYCASTGNRSSGRTELRMSP